jgi:hypothetical protein
MLFPAHRYLLYFKQTFANYSSMMTTPGLVHDSRGCAADTNMSLECRYRYKPSFLRLSCIVIKGKRTTVVRVHLKKRLIEKLVFEDVLTGWDLGLTSRPEEPALVLQVQ